MKLLSVGNNPVTVREGTIEGIWETASAWNVPWNCSDKLSVGDEGAAWISLADTLSSLGEGANLTVNDELGVVGSVAWATVSVGQSCGGQNLEVIWCRSSSNSSTSPSGNNSVDAASGEWWCQWNWLNVGIGEDDILGLNDWDTKGSQIVNPKNSISDCSHHLLRWNPGWVVLRVVADDGADVDGSTSVQQNCSDNDADSVLGAVNGAMSWKANLLTHIKLSRSWQTHQLKWPNGCWWGHLRRSGSWRLCGARLGKGIHQELRLFLRRFFLLGRHQERL